jgi:gamma-glutamyltranspeptidase/glutathione hydrolase
VNWSIFVNPLVRLLISGVVLPRLLYSSVRGAAAAFYNARDRIHPVFARQGLVVTQEARASQIGLAILQHGGNATDVAVAIGFALAVTLPQAGNLGGSGIIGSQTRSAAA